jgi:hypothetical protein
MDRIFYLSNRWQENKDSCMKLIKIIMLKINNVLFSTSDFSLKVILLISNLTKINQINRYSSYLNQHFISFSYIVSKPNTMKNLFAILAIIWITGTAYGQEEKPDKKGWIGFSMGAAIPVGDFGSENVGNAGTGFNFTLINFGYKFHPNIGITAMIFGSVHASKSGSIIDLGNWAYGGFLVGPLASFPTKFVEFDFRVLGGFTGVGTTNDIENNGIGFCYNIGLGFRLNASRLIAFPIYVDYLHTNPSITILGTTDNSAVDVINITFGLAFRIR